MDILFIAAVCAYVILVATILALAERRRGRR